MTVSLDRRILPRYPFLKESQEIVRSYTDSLDAFLDQNQGRIALDQAHDRVHRAIMREDPHGETPAFPPEQELVGYVLARIIVSCMNDRRIIEQFARYESNRAFWFLASESDEIRQYIGQEVEFDPATGHLPLSRYVELTAMLGDEKWRLVHRPVRNGFVKIAHEDADDLLREAIRRVILDHLPAAVPDRICKKIAPIIDTLTVAHQERMHTDFGSIEESAFPPCIRALISAVAEGTNLPHTGRFAITAFLHTIGMETTRIVEIYSHAPDFDIERTMYQVCHITGGGGTEYTPPSCATMRTYGLCVGKDALCERINHPLSYYRARKQKEGERSTDMAADHGAGTAESDDKDDQGTKVSGPTAENRGEHDDHEDEHQQ